MPAGAHYRYSGCRATRWLAVLLFLENFIVCHNEKIIYGFYQEMKAAHFEGGIKKRFGAPIGGEVAGNRFPYSFSINPIRPDITQADGKKHRAEYAEDEEI